MTALAMPDRLPELRPELQLLKGSPNVHGEPTWLIHDPLVNRFIQIEVAAYEALRHWREAGSAAALIARTNTSQTVALDETSLSHLLDFLYANQLTVEPRRDGWRNFARTHAARQHSLVAKIVHNYLFFRIPLCRPQPFLLQTLPLARALWSQPAQIAVVAMGLVGAYLVSRQWDEFTSTFQSYFTWEGALLAALALGLLKAAHELGHAYTAVAFGCRVHTMGLAFIVMAPLLYTDVTDAWRLTDRRQRLQIDSAGIKVELAIAAVALFLWAFLPDGVWRGTAFLVCAISAASSLAINLNPFMRFDGYYLLSEAVGVENLQSRAFTLGKWKLRELLFGIGMPCPEDFSRRLTGTLVVYAWAVWVYRLAMFFGIALLVYHYFFKVLGIILFAVEIIFFIALPIVTEFKAWFQMRRVIVGRRRAVITAALAALAALACLVPWSTRVEIPAIIEKSNLQMIFPPRAAQVSGLHVGHGAFVRAGDPIVTLASPDLDRELELARISLKLAQLQYARRMSDLADRENSLILESTMASLAAKIEGLEKERQELTVVAPFDGRIVEFNPELPAGRWISQKDQIAVIAAEGPVVARGYVAESDLWRLTEGARAKFVPESSMRGSFALRVEQVSAAGVGQIEIGELASVNSGRIAVNPDDKRRLIPTSAQYLVRMSAVDEPRNQEVAFRGVAIAEGKPESLVARFWRQALKVLVRESGA